ncbi:MAG: FKBP-type peptidyl-prolyl cis-trans isomerase [Bacteroidetes bacterium]|nr:FKBP-type peptidyl-prolyl cis-trans isomerase [Bacteroidota bacterium]
MKKTILVLAVLLMAVGFVLVSCQSGNDKFPGFKQNDNGLYYKFYTQGTDTVFPKLGDYVTVDMMYASEDSIIFDSKLLPQVMKMPMVVPTFKGDVYEGIYMMQVGDSATFICNADSTFSKLFQMQVVPPDLDSLEHIYFHIKLNNIETLEEVKAAQQAEMERLQKDEAALRTAFIEENYPDAKPVASGLYYIETKKGKGIVPKTDQKVKVHYKGMFLDGSVFDSSFDRDEPIEFVLGTRQVIQGWDEGIGMMKKDGKAVLVVPSNIAYGPNGRGSIPPYSTLVFEVELIDIK